MSKENVEIVRRLFAAYTQGDPEKFFELLDPHIVWINYASHPESRPFIGHEGVVEWLKAFQADIRGFRIDVAEIIDGGGDQVIAVNEARGTGATSGVPLELRFAAVVTLLNGKIVRVQGFETRAKALEAAGLSE